ncbi:MAG: hypothetical protein IJ247_02675 [Bacilli bacterium]|nr:hypothetical protein [Bacilli bacterium]
MKKQSILLLSSMVLVGLVGCNNEPAPTSESISSASVSSQSSASSEWSIPEKYKDYKRLEDFSQGVVTYIDSKGKEQSLTRHNLEANASQPSLLTLGEQRILVVPIGLDADEGTSPGYSTVSCSGRPEKQTPERLQQIENLFFGPAESTGWQSLKSFYDTSSFGQVTITGNVMTMDGGWFKPGEYFGKNARPRDYSSQTALNDIKAYYTTEYAKEGHGLLPDDAPSWDWYDQDKDGYIDTIWMVYSAAIHAYETTTDGNSYWAYVSRTGNSPSVSSPNPMCHAWASIDFMDQAYGEGLDAHTFIHETGHIFGLDDYYNYDHNSAPMAGVDMMDNNVGDHCAFSKFQLGWIKPYIVDDTALITLKPTTTNKDNAVILPSPNYNGTAFDEYMMVEFMSPVGLAEKDYLAKYPAGIQGFSKPGLRVTHVDARARKTTLKDILSTPEEVAEAQAIRVMNTPSGRGYASYRDGWQNYDYSSSIHAFSMITVMQASGYDKDKNCLTGSYVAKNSDLYVKNFSFDLEPYEVDGELTNEAWCLMPSGSNLWNKAQSPITRDIDDTCKVGYTFTVLNVTKDECTFVVNKI